jgi:hypothetical protein
MVMGSRRCTQSLTAVGILAKIDVKFGAKTSSHRNSVQYANFPANYLAGERVRQKTAGSGKEWVSRKELAGEWLVESNSWREMEPTRPRNASAQNTG